MPWICMLYVLYFTRNLEWQLWSGMRGKPEQFGVRSCDGISPFQCQGIEVRRVSPVVQ